jgi:hypothetical protein
VKRTEVHGGAHLRPGYGSEGWRFESRRARSGQRPSVVEWRMPPPDRRATPEMLAVRGETGDQTDQE